jgi:hypothetical protein
VLLQIGDTFLVVNLSPAFGNAHELHVKAFCGAERDTNLVFTPNRGRDMPTVV